MESNLEIAYYNSPIGTLEIKGDADGIQSVLFIDEEVEETKNSSEVLQNCITQLDEYFSGTRKEFELHLNIKATKFQEKVWRALLHIPFGKTRSYLEQAKGLGDVKAIRAVALANGKNPIAIIIPCHRIVGSDGSLTGYAGGIHRKKWLLEHEGVLTQQSLF